MEACEKTYTAGNATGKFGNGCRHSLLSPPYITSSGLLMLLMVNSSNGSKDCGSVSHSTSHGMRQRE
eukprot:1740504-Heterocapsa_arctica.AAC.1